MRSRVVRGLSPIAIVLTLGLAGTASAADWHVGASFGPSRGRVDCVPSFPCDKSDAGGKLSLAYQVTPSLDVQLAWLHGGRFDGGGTTTAGAEFGGTFKVDAVGLTTGWRWDIARLWSVVARGGFASVHARFDDAAPVSGSHGKTALQPLLGLGLAYQLTPAIAVGVDLDATRLKAHTSHGSLQMLGIAAQLSF